MKKNLLFTLIISFSLILFFVCDAFSSNEETIESLKIKEEEILSRLNQNLTKQAKSISEKKKAINEAINKEIANNVDNEPVIKENKSTKATNLQPKKEATTKTSIASKNLLYKNFSKRLNKRRTLKKQLALKRQENKAKGLAIEAPIIVASNKIIEIENSKVSKNLNRYIRKANTILNDIKKDDSKRVVAGGKYYTISNDYFDDEDASDPSSFVYVTNDVSLHTLPSLSSKLIYLVKANTRLKLDKNYGAWYRVKSADNKYGWILGDMINFSNPNSLSSTLKNRGKGL